MGFPRTSTSTLGDFSDLGFPRTSKPTLSDSFSLGFPLTSASTLGDSFSLGSPRISVSTLGDTAQNATSSGRPSTATISDTFSLTHTVIGTLTDTDVQPQSLLASAVGNVDVSFKLDNALPKDGKIVIILPSGFTISSGAATALVSDNFDGGTSVTLDVSNRIITITRDGTGTDLSADTTVNLQFSNIKNPAASGSTGTYAIKTTNSSGTTIDQDLSVGADTITVETTASSTGGTTALTIVRSADLAVVKTGSPSSLIVGNNVTYTLTVTNNGPDNATGVTLTDTLPAGATHVSSSTSRGTCSGTTTVVCQLATLSPLQTANVTIVVTLNEVGTVSNSARVTGDRKDVSSANNTSTVTTQVTSPLTVALTYAPDRAVRAGETLIITATFSGAVTGTPTIAIDTTGTDLNPTSMTASSGSTVWTYSYLVPSGSDGTATVAIAGATDAAGTSSQTPTNDTFTIDTVGPTVALSYQPNRAVRAGETVIITATFDQAIIGTPSIAIDTSGTDLSSTAMTDSGDGRVWTFSYVVPAGSDGTATVTISGAADAAGNSNAQATNNSFAIDSTAPTVALTYEPNRAVEDDDTLIITATFSEPVTGPPTIAIDTAGIDLVATAMTASGNGTVWTFSYDVPSGSDGTATVSIAGATDEAGNPNQPATNNTFVIGITGPSVVLSYEPDRAVRAGETIIITATFSQAVTGTPTIAIDTEGTDLSATAMTDSGDGTVWTFSYVVPADSDGTATVTIAGATDAVGNPNQPATNNTFTIDTVGPTVVLSYQPDGPVGAGQTLLITATFSEAVSGTPTIAIDTAGIDLEATAMTDSGDGTVWTFSYTVPAGSEGTATVTIAGATDEAGNTNQPATNNAFTITDNTVDLSVAATGSPEPAPRGSILTYTLSIANAGPADATGVTLTSNLPAGVIFVRAIPGSPVCNALSSTVTCELGNLANGANTSVIIEVTIGPTLTGVIINNVRVDSDGLDPNQTNNADTEETTVQVGELTYAVTITDGDLDSTLVTLTDFPDPVFVGNNLTYNLVVTNNGQGEVTGVTLTVTLPSSVDFESVIALLELVLIPVPTSGTRPAFLPPQRAKLTNASPSLYLAVQADPPGDIPWTGSGILLPAPEIDTHLIGVGECTAALGTIVCDLGDLASDQSAAATIIVTPRQDGLLNNNAKVGYEGSEATVQASESTRVLRLTDLSVTAAQIPDSVVAGSRLNYVLTVRNHGPSDATSVTLTDALPPGVELVSGAAGLGACKEVDSNLVCSLGVLASGDSVTVTIPLKVRSATLGAITNTANVGGNEADLDTSNNAVTQSIRVNLEADVSVTIALASDNVLAGSKVDYILTITNNGPSDATGVNLTNLLPQEVDFISVEPGFPTCNESEGIVACSLDRLRSGDSVTTGISGMVASSAIGTITNTGSVVSHEADPTMRNNTATNSISINRAADLALNKIYSPELTSTINQNQLAYTLNVINNGPSDAVDVTITDTLSEGVSIVSFNGDAQECTETDGTVICELGTLPKGASASVVIIVAPTSEGTITNTASATANELDPNTGNDSSAVAASFRFVTDVPGPTLSTEPTAPDSTPVPAPTIPPAAPPETAPTPVGPLADGDDSTLLIILIVVGSLVTTLLALFLYHNRLIFAGLKRRKRDEDEV